ncbi:MAG TPA: DUF2505 family protein [Labilithrix sp.]|nr:DUF2505 family protein [Labilithrix sp.]
MSTFTMKHELECDVERFWKLFFEAEFNEKLFKALEFPEWKLVESKETDTQIIRKVKATPKMDAPAPVVKLLGSSFGYDEVGTFDKASKTLKFVIKTNVMTEKLRNEGTVKCEPRGEGKSTRVVEIIAEAKVFGLGGMIESSFEKSFRTGWQKSADFINAWVKDHP